jgi:acyl-CoA thioesterase-1
MATRRTVLLGTFSTMLTALGGSPTRAAAPAPVRIVALGDSLTAGYGLPADAAFPVRLERALRAEGRAVQVINAGVSGDTTAGGLARLDWALAEKPDLVILELGANDGLRGIDPKLTEANLDQILTRLDKAGIGVLLAGMLAPPNYGKAFESAFNALFPRLAKAHDAVFYPFYLDGVAGHPELNQPDGLHPTAAGIDVIVSRILPSVRTLLDRHAARAGTRHP